MTRPMPSSSPVLTSTRCNEVSGRSSRVRTGLSVSDRPVAPATVGAAGGAPVLLAAFAALATLTGFAAFEGLATLVVFAGLACPDDFTGGAGGTRLRVGRPAAPSVGWSPDRGAADALMVRRGRVPPRRTRSP